MKKKLVLISTFILISCSNQPECDDNDIKIEVKQIMKKVHKKALQNEYYEYNYSNYDVKRIYRSEKKNIYYDYDDIKKSRIGDENSRLKDSIYKKYKSDLKYESIDFSDSVIRNTKMSFNKIRITNTNKDLEICECASNLIIGNDLFGVEYKAQTTEDDDIYVELLDYNEIK